SFEREAALRTDVFEMTVAIVMIELRKMRCAAPGFESRAVRDEYILRAVAIIVKDRDAIAGSFENEIFARLAAKGINPGQSGGLRHVLEPYGIFRRRSYKSHCRNQDDRPEQFAVNHRESSNDRICGSRVDVGSPLGLQLPPGRLLPVTGWPQ